MTASSSVRDFPAGYERGIRLGARFTMWFAAPWTLVIFPLAIAVQAVTGTGPFHKLDGAGLEQAGRFPTAIVVEHLVDGSGHIVFFITFLTFAVAIALRWPVRAALLAFFFAASLLFGWAKTFTAILTATSLGAQYLAADAAGKTAVLAAGSAYDGIYAGLQLMDSYPIVLGWILISLLPTSSGLSRWIRGLGWALVLLLVLPWDALLGVDVPVGFLIALIVMAVYLVLVGRWLSRLPVAAGR